jgi:hypothetical protein
MSWNRAKFIYPSGYVCNTFVCGVPGEIKNCCCEQGLITLYYDGFGLGGYHIYRSSKNIERIDRCLDKAFDNLFDYSWRVVCKQYPNKESKVR